MNVEAIFILHQYEPYKSNDESYRLVAERVYKGPHFDAKVRLEYISLKLILKYKNLEASINMLRCIC